MDDIERRILNSGGLGEEDLVTLSVLAAMLWIRTPYFREMTNHNMGNLEKSLYQLRASDPGFTDHLLKMAKETNLNLTPEKAEQVRQFVKDGQYKLAFNNVLHLQFMVMAFEDFRRRFYAAKWRFYIAGGNRKFVTSSAPCIEIFPENWNIAYGPAFYSRRHIFPLSPHISVEPCRPSLPGKRTKRQLIMDDDVFEFNRQQAHWSYIENDQHSRCYGPRKEELEELAAWQNNNGPKAAMRLAARRAVSAQNVYD